MPRLFKRRRRCGAKIQLSKKWWGEYDDAGKLKRVPLHADKTTAQIMLGQLAQGGAADPLAKQLRRPLADHLDDWERALEAKGVTLKQVQHATGRARRLIEGCGFTRFADVQPSRVQTWLACLRVPSRRKGSTDGTPAGARTQGYYLRAARQFFRWLVLDRRCPHNPLDGMTGPVVTEVRHGRQSLSPAQLDALYRATLASPEVYRGLTGTDRYWLYLLASVTGFRVAELASLTPGSFDWSDPPTAVIASGRAKNRRLTRQPLPVEIVSQLRAWVDGRPPREPLWSGTWHERSADMIRLDLAAAGIPYVVDGPDGPLYADVHCLRHTFIASLDRAGATLKQAMALARHTDPRLTMRVYGRAALADLGSVVDRLVDRDWTVPPVSSGERQDTPDRKVG